MSRLSNHRKFLDKNDSRVSMSTNPSSRFPGISSSRLNSSIPLRHKRTQSIIDQPSAGYTQPLRYDSYEGIIEQPESPEQDPPVSSRKDEHPRYRHKVRQQSETLPLDWIASYSKMPQKGMGEAYSQRVSQNLKHYGDGMLRRSHRNSLGRQQQQGQLVRLHYRLKKQREAVMLQKQQRAAQKRFKALLGRFQSI